MTHGVEHSLRQIERGLHSLNRKSLMQRLRPGVDGAEVDRRLSAIGLASSADVQTLYGWHDGTDAEDIALDDVHIVPGFYFASLDEATTNYRVFVRDLRWQDGWLPILANGGGDFLVVDLGVGSSGAVRHFRIDEAVHPVEYLQLGDLLATAGAAFEREVFFVDRDGYLEMDDLAYSELARVINPQVDWWAQS